MNAEIVAIGTELLLDATVDANSAYLAQRVTLVRDDLREIVDVLRAAMQRVALVVCSGGLARGGRRPLPNCTHRVCATAASAPIYLARGIDFGLAQAHDFVESAALETLRRRLEAWLHRCTHDFAY